MKKALFLALLAAACLAACAGKTPEPEVQPKPGQEEPQTQESMESGSGQEVEAETPQSPENGEGEDETQTPQSPESGTGEEEKLPEAGKTKEETITVSFVNTIKEGDVWLILNTEANRKTTLWGTPSIKKGEVGKAYSISTVKNADDTYLLRMIDVDGGYYSSKALTLKEGYSLKLYQTEDIYRVVRISVADEKGQSLEDSEVFNAAL